MMLRVCVLFSVLQLCSCLVYHINEERVPTYFIGNVGQDANVSSMPAVTPDVLQRMEYSFIGDSQEMFEIDQRSGILSGKTTIDREVFCPHMVVCKKELRVAARSGNFFLTINVIVYIDDINDNAPTFPQSSVALEISEGPFINSTFPLLGASDIDMGPNNSITHYKITPDSGIFALDVIPKLDGTSDLNLRLIRALDRELVDRYTIYVSALDGGNPPKSGTLTVNITVTDINDKAPIFTQQMYNVTIKEDMPMNSLVVQVTANDGDTGRNAEVSYKFATIQTDNIDIFNMNRASGEITLIGAPEYSLTPYKIIVEAVDNGEPRKSSQAQVIVNINDTNNNVPVISINVLSEYDYAIINENANMGDIVAHVEVEDADTGINGHVSCHIEDSDYFKLQPMPGTQNEFKVVVNGTLDREDIIEHIVTVYCEDGGTPALNSTKSFKVQIQDQNDNTPQFINKIYPCEIYENEPNGTVVVKVSATDNDQGHNAKVRYYINPNGQVDFRIANPVDGIITTRHSFDREKTSHFNFTVIAVDGGNPVALTATATILVRILDKNDITPEFDSDLFEFHVPEEIANLTTIGFVRAKDGDAGENGNVTFVMDSNSIGKVPLMLKSNGEIKSIRRLDREKNEEFNFTVIARDNGVPSRSSSATVIVRLTDINDNDPEFIFPNSVNYSVNLSYLAEVDSVVTTIIAVDPDKDVNAEIRFNIIEGNQLNLFKIDTYSGEIFLARKIHLHEIRIYDLLLTATDQGSVQQKTSRQLCSIHIKFVNTTAVAQKIAEDEPQNLIIAIVIAIVTLVLSIAIIITICVIRRADVKKHNYRAKSMEEMKIMETMARNSSTRSSSSRGSADHIIPHRDFNRNRKEVSFSLEEDSMSYRHPSSSPSMSTFKSSPVDPQPPSVHHAREDSTLSDKNARNINRMESLRLQQRILQTKDQQQWQQEERIKNMPYMEIARPSELKGDNQSDLSEESLTGDSGRGGSEEDIRNSGVPHNDTTGVDQDSTRSRHLSVANSSGISSIGSHSLTNHMNFSTFGRGSPSEGLSTFPRNAGSKNILNVSRHPSSSSVNHSGKNLQRLHSEHYSPQRKALRDIPSVPKSFIQDRLHRTENQNLVRCDDTYSESCNTTARDDDDATTTSGSYTINPDDLCNDIDNLFFKSDTVV
ncbi:protocadherin gamma-B1-like [Saccostrea cucullata]|uniref:protocadherin gamma-B1-like n=1 Tax=Saccostrea cuccullata TaxID=36930 RepID=UPI002ED0F32A